MASSSVLDEFCGSEFWNTSLTWNTSDPDFTPCFEKTVLVWIPCSFLLLFTGFEICYIINSRKKDIPWNFLNTSKITVTGVLCILMLSDFFTSLQKSSTEFIPSVDIYTPLIKLLIFLLSAALLYYNKKYGLRTSGLLFLFWFLLPIFGAAQFRTEIRSAQRKAVPDSYYQYVSYLIYYPLVLLMFLLNCFADQPAKITKYPKTLNPCPEQGASFLSRLVFAWFDPMAWKGFRKPLETKDLWDMNPEDSSAEIVTIFQKHWKNTVANCEGTHAHARAQFEAHSGHIDFIPDKKREASILPALCKSFGLTFLFGATLNLMEDVLTFVSPQILGLIITFVEVGDYSWKGPFYAVLLFLTAVAETLVGAHYYNKMVIIGMRIRTALVSTIYRKTLKVSNAARKDRTAGEIVNLISVDVHNFMDVIGDLNALWSAPLQICLGTYFLWQELGPSVLAGLAVMIVLIPVNGFITNKSKILQVKQMDNKDERVKLMNEVLSGIKVLKLYAWEPSFEAHVLKVRDKEIKLLKQAAYLNAGISFIWSCTPFLVSLVSFATYVLVDPNNVLNASKVYVSISLFNILGTPLSMLPPMISDIVRTYVSLKRINTFMNADEVNPDNVTHDPSEAEPLAIENGTFTWDDDPVLKNINIRIRKRTLTAVVGSVGSGKSSLLSAFLGEMDKISGKVNTYGSVAYVSQQAWIQNATFRDNILFGKDYDKFLYDKVIEACALGPDLDILPGRDQTEIGEKGINLSGGQKQRVSLARAVYANAEIYFLDDPLSAVDSHVGKHIFEQVLGPKGLLKDKTRVLVTHGITYLPQTDQIVVLVDGEVSESGTYQELLEEKGAFSEFLTQHVQEQSEEEDELNELTTTLSSQISEDLPRQLVRMRSRVSESKSETGIGSDPALNASWQRQKSEDSAKSQRKGSFEKNGPIHGEKLIEDETSETGNVSWQVYKHYIRSIGVVLIIATVISNVCFQGFSIGSNVWLGIWADDKDVVGGNGTVDTAKRDLYLGVYGALGIGQAIMSVFMDLLPQLGGVTAAAVLHKHLLHNVMRLPLRFFDTTPMGRVLSRFAKDVEIVDDALPWHINDCMYCISELIGILAVISYTTPLFLIVVAPIGLLYYFIQRFYVATSRQLKRLESVTRSPIYSHFGETISGVQAIRAYGHRDRFVRESEHRVDSNQVCYYPRVVSKRWLAVRLGMMGNLVILFAALFAVLGRDQMPGLVGLSITYALKITHSLNWLVRMASDLETNIVAVERIKEYAEVPREAAWEIPDKIMPAFWPETGAVTFKEYSVRYRPGLDLVLKHVNFTVNGSEKVGIVGRTGAGKSSLTLSLFRIIEASEGQILIDGVDISSVGLHTLRSKLTIIPQDAVLFSGSLRMNLDPFDQHTDDEVWRSLEHSHLKSFVKGLASGLQHGVTEGGENLSVGQRQLICLARALLRKTKVLILDEATAAVDLETDDLIQRTIRTEFRDCTVLTIAHRLNTIMDSDRVIVLDRGRVVEFDTPANLLMRPESIFYGMCKDAGLA